MGAAAPRWRAPKRRRRNRRRCAPPRIGGRRPSGQPASKPTPCRRRRPAPSRTRLCFGRPRAPIPAPGWASRRYLPPLHRPSRLGPSRPHRGLPTPPPRRRRPARPPLGRPHPRTGANPDRAGGPHRRPPRRPPPPPLPRYRPPLRRPAGRLPHRPPGLPHPPSPPWLSRLPRPHPPRLRRLPGRRPPRPACPSTSRSPRPLRRPPSRSHRRHGPCPDRRSRGRPRRPTRPSSRPADSHPPPPASRLRPGLRPHRSRRPRTGACIPRDGPDRVVRGGTAWRPRSDASGGADTGFYRSPKAHETATKPAPIGAGV